MARIQVPIFFDYASTLCYIAWRIVGELERELEFDALWKGVPIAIRDHRAKPGRIVNDRERQKVLLVAAETGVPVAMPPAWLDSIGALEGSEIAREVGVFRVYHDAMFRAAFEERRDIGHHEVLTEIAARAGLDPDRFGRDLRAGAMRERIEANKREADEFSALGYPTFILGDFPLTGIQPISSMRLLLGRFIKQRSAEPQA
jgi:predicted DsbA family dithiol-disulfide isomerase